MFTVVKQRWLGAPRFVGVRGKGATQEMPAIWKGSVACPRLASLWAMLLFWFVVSLDAKADAGVKLAMIADPEVTLAVDLMTARFSANTNIHLLERAEIDRARREQGLSAANGNDIKLGRILGADGLLIFRLARTKQATNLLARLVAVKPGVALRHEAFPWPVSEPEAWAESVAGFVNLFLPKLRLEKTDAIPLSVLNFRSPASSHESLELERQLRLLIAPRLMREPRLIVLERQNLGLAADEKALNQEEAEFWDGRYLLDGTIDQKGYSESTVTLSARLLPPRGGAAVMFEASGSRTNLGQVVNHLAAKVLEAMRIQPFAHEWSAAEEAAKFFEEAKWALRWGMHAEAQAAADSAWALGKTDLDCAAIRVRAYLAELSGAVLQYQMNEVTLSPGYKSDGTPANPPFSEAKIQAEIQLWTASLPPGLSCRVSRWESNTVTVINFQRPSGLPDPANIARAMHLLELFNDYNLAHADGAPLAASGPTTSKNSEWHDLGLSSLTAASQVLRDFNVFQESRSPTTEKLAELRALSRTVAAWFCSIPAMRDSYFVGDRFFTHEEWAKAVNPKQNIFQCKVTWGCFWQERPEDGIALYRELLASPVFSYIHQDFWLRDLACHRLVGWNAADRQRLPRLWQEFVGELAKSTNVLWRLESKALAFADADYEADMVSSWENLLSSLVKEREALVNCKTEVFYLGWGIGYLDHGRLGSGIGTPARDSMTRLYSREYYPKFSAMRSELEKAANARASAAVALAAEKKRLSENKPTTVRTPTLVRKPPNVSPRPVTFSQTRTIVPTVSVEAGPPPIVLSNVITISEFYRIPIPPMDNFQVRNTLITGHHWQEGRLVLDLICEGDVYSYYQNGNFRELRTVNRFLVATFDPASKRWVVRVGDTPESRFYHRTTLFRGQLYTSTSGQIQKFDQASMKWQRLGITEIGDCQLFAVNDRLYASDKNLILEILQDGKQTRVLASARRQPPILALDAENLGTAFLFKGPGGSLSVCTSNYVWTWTNENWQKLCPMPPISLVPMDSGDHILFWGPRVSMSRLNKEGNSVELCFPEKDVSSWSYASPFGRARSSEAPPKTLWRPPSDLPRNELSFAARKSDLYALVNHYELKAIDKDNRVIKWEYLPKDGYHAALLCFRSDSPAAAQLLLKFEGKGELPLKSNHHFALFGTMPSNWLCFIDTYLILGAEMFPSEGVGQRQDENSPTGIWLLPLDKIDAALGTLK